ncbi:hypothetical protein NDY24_21175 [Xanthomonas hortorum pv. pelargonii]|nr:hypothetical protein NDY24_21175 [Xanthomonas hortorum pv. pelargonii]
MFSTVASGLGVVLGGWFARRVGAARGLLPVMLLHAALACAIALGYSHFGLSAWLVVFRTGQHRRRDRLCDALQRADGPGARTSRPPITRCSSRWTWPSPWPRPWQPCALRTTPVTRAP